MGTLMQADNAQNKNRSILTLHREPVVTVKDSDLKAKQPPTLSIGKNLISPQVILQKILEFISEIDFLKIAIQPLLHKIQSLEDKMVTYSDPNNPVPEDTVSQYQALKTDLEKFKLKTKHIVVICVEQIQAFADKNGWGICKNNDFIYIFNGAFWQVFDKEQLQLFFSKASEKLGVDQWDARYHGFANELFTQFMFIAHLARPVPKDDTVLINFSNGTFDINPNERGLRPTNSADFITYQLPFEYNASLEAPIFQQYLNRVLPDEEMQAILAEYLGYLFVKSSTLKLEKTLLLYGKGANGKSVFFEVVNALLGGYENVSYYSLQNLTNENGYSRTMLANKLLNYASEINGKLETSIFKQLVSGEPVEARLPYGEPHILTNYAKLIFNCNELPKDVEQTHAYYRRFLIIPFKETIPDQEQDKQLAQKIISSELPGVFNWVLAGLDRLLQAKNFTVSEAVNAQIEEYKLQSDSVQMFLVDEGYEKSTTEFQAFKELFVLYRTYCLESGYRSVSKRTFSDRLKRVAFEVVKVRTGMIVYTKKLAA